MTTPLWFKREINLGDIGPDVRVVRRKLGLDPEQPYDIVAAERVRGMGRHAKVATEGEVNEAMAEVLGEAATTEAGLAPEWYQRDLQLWQEGEDVRALRKLLNVPNLADNRFDPDLEAAVRRFQSAQGLPVDGLVTEDLARLLGEA